MKMYIKLFFRSFKVNGNKMTNEPIIDSIMELTYVPYQVDVLPNEITVISNFTVIFRISKMFTYFC